MKLRPLGDVPDADAVTQGINATSVRAVLRPEARPALTVTIADDISAPPRQSPIKVIHGWPLSA